MSLSPDAGGADLSGVVRHRPRSLSDHNARVLAAPHSRMQYLLATDAVHTTAAGCDYLLGRLDPSDRVTVLTVEDPAADTDERDAGDAANVATARLTGFCELEFEQRAVPPEPRNGGEAATGDVADEILGAVDALDVDVVLVGPHAGAPGAGPELGGTARAVLEGATVPVVVLPLEALS